MKYFYNTITSLLICCVTFSQTLQKQYYVTDRQVYSVAQHGNTIYLGGNFSTVGPNTGHAALVDNNTGLWDETMPDINGTVNAIVADGNGGWYAGGLFTYANDSHFTNLVHINPDKTLDNNFTPQPNLAVSTLCVYDNTLYVGGNFNNIAGQHIQSAAAFDIATGNLTAWQPNVDNVVSKITAGNGLIYMLGGFGNAGGQTRSRLAAVDKITGLANSFSVPPSSTNGIYAMALLGDTLYIGGNFNQINGQSRGGLAALNVTTGYITNWAPTADNLVTTIYAYGGKIFVGGGFGQINGKNHARLVELDAVTGQDASWDAQAVGTAALSATVNAMVGVGDTIYVAGYFSSICGQPRSNLAAVDINTGKATNWNPQANSYVYALALSNNHFYAGGDFTSVNIVPRNYIAALDATTGKVTDWAPQLDGNISVLAAKGDSLIIAGNFFNVNGGTKRFLGALDSASGNVLPWNPAPDGRVSAIEIYENTIYVGGTFYNVAGAGRYAIAGIDGTSGTATAFNTAFNQSLNTVITGIKRTPTKVYVWGMFTSVGDSARRNLVAIDAETGIATGWNPAPDQSVQSLFISGGDIYAAGYFSNIGGKSHSRIAILDTISGISTNWDASILGANVNTLAEYNGILYAGGSFIGAGGLTRNNIVAINESTGLVTDWNPGTDYAPINVIVPYNSSIIFGGNFTKFAYYSVSNFAVAGVAITLPLNLLNFTAASQNNNVVKLNWLTSNEINTAYFGIERSYDGIAFSTIAKMNAYGKNINTYTYNDVADKVNKTLFYRLKMVDKDGRFTYSKTIAINITLTAQDFVIYPNPAHGHIALHVTSEKNQRAMLIITDMNGRAVQQQYVQLYAGSNNIAVPLAQTASGLYVAVLRMADKKLSRSFLSY